MPASHRAVRLNPADQLRNAIAANDTTAILAAMAAGATATPALIRLAATNPQILAALPANVAATVTGRQAQAESTAAQEQFPTSEALAIPKTSVDTPKGFTGTSKPAQSTASAAAQPKGGNPKGGAALAQAIKGLKLKPAKITGGGEATIQAPGRTRGEGGKLVTPDDSNKKGGGRGA